MDSFNNATKDMPRSQNWKAMKAMSSRFVFSTLQPCQSETAKAHDRFLTCRRAS